MPRRETRPPCPIGRAVEVVGEHWTLLIMRNAQLGTTRFEEFRAELGIADNVLAQRLARLVDAGLLTRVPYRNGGRTRDEYRLTGAGADLAPILRALAQWGDRHITPAEPGLRMSVLHGECGRPVRERDGYCEHCERHVERSEERWLRPWRRTEPYELAAPVA